MKSFSVLMLFLLSINLIAQEIVTTTGGYNQSPAGSFTYTIGEPAVETYTNSSAIITQGFNQTKLTVTEVSSLSNLTLEVSVYPNPAQEFLIIKTNAFIDLNYQLFDASGRLIIMNDINELETSINFNTISTGVYFIKLFKYNKEIKIFKIEKQ